MFSLPKLLGLIAILSVVWAAFTWGERVSRLRRQRSGSVPLRRPRRQSSGEAGRARRDGPADPPAVATLKPCPVCGVFISDSNPCRCSDSARRG